MINQEIQMLAAFFRMVLRFPLPQNINCFKVIKGSQYQNILAIVCIGTVLEIPMVHFLIHLTLEESSFKNVLQVIILLLSFYGMVWFFGDYRRLKEGGYTIGSDALKIDLSIRWQGEISFSHIIAAEISHLVPESTLSQDWRKPAKVQAENVGILKIGLEKPNVRIYLNRVIEIKGLFGSRKIFRDIHFYVSEPETFLEKVQSKIAK